MAEQTKQPEWIEINTLKDIIDKVPEESLDSFLKDLKLFIETAKQTKKNFTKILSEEYYDKYVKNIMYWTDDWEVGLKWVNITFNIKSE